MTLIYKTFRKLFSKVTSENELKTTVFKDAKRGYWLLHVMSFAAICSVLTITFSYFILLFKS